MNITLICWQCGARKVVDVDHAPEFAFQLAAIAQDAGLVGVIDLNHSRSLVFCSDKCKEKAQKKDGTFRKRPDLKLNEERNVSCVIIEPS